MLGRARLVCIAGLLGCTSGCFTTDLDPDAVGAFACESTEDCPDGQTCINQVCEAGEPPTLAILAPEDEQRFTMMDNPPPTRTVAVNVQGTLQLRDPAASDEHVLGEGHVAIIVDGVEAQLLTSGPLSGGIPLDVTIDNTAGAHRIAAVAVRNDGKRYDNDGAMATRLFWVDDGQPQVALKRPWPGADFPLVAPDPVEVEVSTINFEIVPLGMDRQEGAGHAHVHYDDVFPACPEDTEGCDLGYLAIVGPPGTSTIMLPDSSETSATLTAILRNIDHTPYLHPFDAADGPQQFVFETISIDRVSE